MFLATCVNTPICYSVFHNLRACVARCYASCVNGAQEKKKKKTDPQAVHCQYPFPHQAITANMVRFANVSYFAFSSFLSALSVPGDFALACFAVDFFSGVVLS